MTTPPGEAKFLFGHPHRRGGDAGALLRELAQDWKAPRYGAGATGATPASLAIIEFFP
jgi:hypothetical protein